MRLGAQDYIMKDNLSRLCPAIARELEEAKIRNKQKRAEKLMIESEARFRTLVENASDGIFVQTDYRFAYINPVMLRILGAQRPDQLLGQLVMDRFHPDFRELVRERIRLTNEEKKHVPIFEETYLRLDGSQVRVEVSATPIIYDGKNGAVVFVRDITERKRAQENLRESEKRFRALIEQSHDAITLLTEDGTVLYDSPSISHVLGYDPTERLGRSVFEYVLPEERQNMAHGFTSFAQQMGAVAPSQMRFLHKDGTTRQIEGVRTNLLHEPAIRAVVVNYRDITEQKKAQEELLRSEEKYRSLVENSQEGIYQSTREGQHVTLNPAFARMLGYESPEEVMATITDIAKQLYANPQDREKLLGLVEEKGSVKDFETEFYKKDGSRIWVSVNMHAIRDDQGRILYYQGIDQDITEKKKIEAERQENIERLHKSLSATINAMAITVETRDPYTAGHQRRVADLARAIAVEMNLKSEQIEGVRMASMIHDIGKISIPSELLTKPTALSSLEFNLIKTHTQSGYNILKDIDFPWPIARIILEHHERFDGSGYPSGLKGKQILLESRILAIADVVEAISSHRPYRPAHGINVALDEITRNKGSLYDPALVDACLRLFREKKYKMAA
jgi:PAS domain S-box/PAS domain S-box/PAS domain S-box/uncharacterized domain HDIG